MRRARIMAATAVVLAAACFAGGPVARAAQTGTVAADTAEVHQFANSSSPVVGTLSKGTQVKMSSSLVRDVHGEYWYKVKLPTGEYGYALATEVKGEELDRELESAGMTRANEEEGDSGALPPIFELRAMGVAGYEINSKTFQPAGEGELNVSLLPFARGYLHRMLAAGVAVQAFSKDTAVLGSLIYRMFTESRAEPEVRLRFGEGLTSSSLLAGMNLGVQYPLTLDSHFYISLFGEGGGLVGLKSGGPVFTFLSAGLGLHF